VPAFHDIGFGEITVAPEQINLFSQRVDSPQMLITAEALHTGSP
jgi:hypothetical protein